MTRYPFVLSFLFSRARARTRGQQPAKYHQNVHGDIKRSGFELKNWNRYTFAHYWTELKQIESNFYTIAIKILLSY